MGKSYYVYIMASISKVIYVGVTNDLIRRVYQHKNGIIPGYTSKYNVTRLVYYEEGADIEQAILREKQLKGWVRRKKIALIEGLNPEWKDLSEEWAEVK
jgi:putative endonuclease